MFPACLCGLLFLPWGSLRLDLLSWDLTGLEEKMKKPCKVPQGNELFSPEFHEILFKKLHELVACSYEIGFLLDDFD